MTQQEPGQPTLYTLRRSNRIVCGRGTTTQGLMRNWRACTGLAAKNQGPAGRSVGSHLPRDNRMGTLEGRWVGGCAPRPRDTPVGFGPGWMPIDHMCTHSQALSRTFSALLQVSQNGWIPDSEVYTERGVSGHQTTRSPQSLGT